MMKEHFLCLPRYSHRNGYPFRWWTSGGRFVPGSCEGVDLAKDESRPEHRGEVVWADLATLKLHLSWTTVTWFQTWTN